MKKILIAVAMFIPAALQAQNSLTSDIVEGGKTLVELIRAIRSPRTIAVANVTPITSDADSCSLKKLADISFKNKSDKTVEVNLFFRIGNSYDKIPLRLVIAPNTQETLYELRSGIYKYKIETGINEEQDNLHEGELKLSPCDKLVREIR